MTLLLALFVSLFVFLCVIASMSFKIASLYKRLSILNLLVKQMLEAGVSKEALDLVYNHYQENRR